MYNFFFFRGLNAVIPYFGIQTGADFMQCRLLPVMENEKIKIKLLENTGHGQLFNNMVNVTEPIDFLDLHLKQ
jgi:hypothetical protein